jgi:hypothetical protein
VQKAAGVNEKLFKIFGIAVVAGLAYWYLTRKQVGSVSAPTKHVMPPAGQFNAPDSNCDTNKVKIFKVNTDKLACAQQGGEYVVQGARAHKRDACGNQVPVEGTCYPAGAMVAKLQ